MSLKNKVDMSEVQDETEIERRFLLRKVPDVNYDSFFRIKQHYISDKDTEIVERVRKTCDLHWKDYKFYHTTKERLTDMSVREIEKEIDEDEYSKFILDSKRNIFKTRFIMNSDDNLKWELDDFESLVIAEIEIPSEDYDLKIPEWLEPFVLMEITGMYQFSNSNLAQ